MHKGHKHYLSEYTLTYKDVGSKLHFPENMADKFILSHLTSNPTLYKITDSNSPNGCEVKFLDFSALPT